MNANLIDWVRQVVSERDRGAEQGLCDHFTPVLRLYVARHLGSAASVDDVVQECLATALVALREGRLREPGKIGQFMYGIAKNKVRETRRREARRQRLDAAQTEEPITEPVLVGLRMHLFFCLAQLNEQARRVLERSYHTEQTAPEIAEAMALSVANVRVIRHRALGALRRCLEGGAQ